MLPTCRQNFVEVTRTTLKVQQACIIQYIACYTEASREFRDAVSNSVSTVSNELLMVKNELERIRNEQVEAWYCTITELVGMG
jgi:hypothetical protein